MGAVNVAKLLKKHADRWQIRGSRHDVVGHLIVDHAAILPDHLFIESEADRLRYSAGDLTFGQNRVKNLSDFLQCDEVIYGHSISCQIHTDLCNVDGPGKGRVGFAAIFFIVPVDIARRFIPGIRLQRAVRPDELPTGGAELFRSVVVTQKAGLHQGLLDSLRR